jgi:2-polyprenyl-3-methyl-5-hydroxy-6-metoxy-1,4-benzoquinol methylase
MLRRFLKDVGSIVQHLAPGSVLDVGCGEGFVAAYLRSQMGGAKNRRYLGLDESVRALEVATRLNPEESFACAKISRLALKDESFDLVICLEVLEHLSDPISALTELRRVSSRYCLISVPHEPIFQIGNLLRGKYIATWGNHPEHLNHWGAKSFRELVSPFFTIQELRQPFPWLLALGKR